MEILSVALANAQRLALVAAGRSYTYRELLGRACDVARRLKVLLPTRTEKWGPRVGLYLPPSVEYVTATWGTWIAGGIVVPLCLSHSTRELQYVIEDTAMPIILTTGNATGKLPSMEGTAVEVIKDTVTEDSVGLPSIGEEEGALIIYTSGTTGNPKGALHTHRSLRAQMESLTQAWEVRSEDVLLHGLPLHHIHGIVIALYTAQYNAACIHLLPRFSPSLVWSAIQAGGVSLFMGVPTMYSHLLSYLNTRTTEEQNDLCEAAQKLRLFVSGSSACPMSIMKRWKEVTGHQVLERYGMTEIGVALSNPLHGERRPGYVGMPVSGIEVKVEAVSGQLLVNGATVFAEYWGKPEATRDAFSEEGYFKTGDIVTKDGEDFKILGRQSVDIIKSGGYKLSALEIENVILEHPIVSECAVIGLPDETYGEVPAAVITVNASLDIEDLKHFCSMHLAKYKIPRRFIQLDGIPRNAMGKVNKRELAQYVMSL